MFDSRTAWAGNPATRSYTNQPLPFNESEWSEVLSEAEVMELASELMNVNSEAELEYFLGDLINKVGNSINKAIHSPVGRAIGGVLKGVAKKALPLAGGALGAYFGGPLGAQIGSGLASAAGNALGLELESLEQEDREFEGGKQFVRFAADTIKNAALAPPNADLTANVQAAAAQAMQKFAPNLLQAAGQEKSRRNSGRWVRDGNNIILYLN